MNYRKLREYEITLMAAYGSKELQELHDPRLNPYCVSKNEYVARQRFLKKS